MATRTLDPDATRLAILTSAEQLFVEKGFAAVSISDIGRAAGVTKSLIHHHFGSKEDLWGAAKMRMMDEYFAAQHALLESRGGDVDLLRESIVAYFRFLQQNPHVVRLLAWLDILEDPVMVEAAKQVTELGEMRLRNGQEIGLLRADVEPRMMITMVLGVVQSWFRSRAMCQVINETTADLDERYLQTILKIFFEGVLPRH